MKRPMSADVSISELKQFRDEGYSNAEIAELLDCSYNTVRRYLGREDGKQTVKRYPNGKPGQQKSESKTEVKESSMASLEMVYMTYAFKGECGEYDVKESEDLIIATLPSGEFRVSINCLPRLIDELNALRVKIMENKR